MLPPARSLIKPQVGRCFLTPGGGMAACGSSSMSDRRPVSSPGLDLPFKSRSCCILIHAGSDAAEQRSEMQATCGATVQVPCREAREGAWFLIAALLRRAPWQNGWSQHMLMVSCQCWRTESHVRCALIPNTHFLVHPQLGPLTVLIIDYLAAACPRINDGMCSWHSNGRT